MIGGRYQRELSVAAAYLVLLAVLACFAPTFFKAAELRAFVLSNAPLLVVAVDMTLVMITRQIDISVGSQFSVCGIVAGLLSEAGYPMGLAVIGAIGCGIACGTVNGLLVTGLGLPPIVATLAMMVMLRESLSLWREGEFVRNLPASFQWFGMSQEIGQWVIVGAALLVVVVFAWGMRSLAIGRAIYATGSSPEAARLMGIRPQRVMLLVYVVMGGLTGFAALLNAVRFASVDPRAGQGLELQAIAAVVVGGRPLQADEDRCGEHCWECCCWAALVRGWSTCTRRRSGRKRFKAPLFWSRWRPER